VKFEPSWSGLLPTIPSPVRRRLVPASCPGACQERNSTGGRRRSALQCRCWPAAPAWAHLVMYANTTAMPLSGRQGLR